jgi:predicted ABC-type ATPase
MPQSKDQDSTAPGQRVMLHGHAWRVVSVTSAGRPAGSVAEPVGTYDAAPPTVAVGPEATPWCVVVGGPNGAGKTTFALEYLPRWADCHEFVNPDLIAAGLSPLNPPAAAVRAGRLLLERIRELSGRRVSFGFETTLAGRGHLATLAGLRDAGYRTCLILIWAPDIELCAARVASRVRAGGHDVPEADLRRRLPRIVANLPRYRALADRFLLVDNTGQAAILVYEHCEAGAVILDAERFTAVRREVGL